MKPEIKAMLPELPTGQRAGDIYHADEIIRLKDFEAWLDKLTEGADKIYLHGTRWEHFYSVNASREALLICPREIKKQTPLEILKDALEQIAVNSRKGRIASQLGDDALVALAQIKAAK